MGEYVLNKDLEGDSEDGIKLDVCIFKENQNHFRVIMTANDDEYGIGTSTKSFPSKAAAMKFIDNEGQTYDDLKAEAIQNLKDYKG